MLDYSDHSSLFPAEALYGISEDGKVTTIQRKVPDDMERVVFRDVYASDSLVASLGSARPRKKSPEEPTSRETDYFICLSKRDGTFEKLISLKDLRFQPFKIAVLESGRFFAAGVDKLNKTPVLAMLDSDGRKPRLVFVNRWDSPMTRNEYACGCKRHFMKSGSAMHALDWAPSDGSGCCCLWIIGSYSCDNMTI